MIINKVDHRDDHDTLNDLHHSKKKNYPIMNIS